eukprot:169670-Rhodomonas_salina.1
MSCEMFGCRPRSPSPLTPLCADITLHRVGRAGRAQTVTAFQNLPLLICTPVIDLHASTSNTARILHCTEMLRYPGTPGTRKIGTVRPYNKLDYTFDNKFSNSLKQSRGNLEPAE